MCKLDLRYRLIFLLLLGCCLLPALPVAAEMIPPAVSEQPVVVGGDRSYPPYEFLDDEGKPTGFNVELTRAIGRVMGMPVEIRFGAWGAMRQGLRDGSIDILQGMAYSDERTAEVDFSLPHAVVHQSIWNRVDGAAIRSREELAGREVIVMRGSIMHDFLLQNVPSAKPILTDSLAEALRLLASGAHDCALVAKLPGLYLSRKLGLSNIEPVARPLIAQDYGFAVRKGNRQLLARFDEGLTILRETGEYARIHRQWLGVLEDQRPQWRRILRYVALVAVPLLLILAGTVLWSRSLKKEVTLRTADLQREVAERKRAMRLLEERQRQLIQADKMTTLGILVSGVAHEINNPNGVVMLNVPLLQKAWRDAEPILEEHYRHFGDFTLGWLKYSRMRREIPHLLGETLESSQRIRRIVEDLKDFARRDDSEQAVRVDLNEVVAAAIRLVEPTVRKATSRFNVQCDVGLPPVRGNSQRLEQVIVNLVVNACQALTAREQGISLETGRDEAGQVWLKVRDQGCGIPAENLEHLLDPFFTTKRESGGTGLGLWVSAGIVNDLGGRLEFASPPGEGTTVTLALPVWNEEVAP
ncbi:transporter substrate-binding domain-containing protein [Trichloromonas sp.]|uniref:transporter substrate-binding domain-containing protein n=1 Tax=Trichloromonas sp. TaxID=3069249 RepID=UPI003D813882